MHSDSSHGPMMAFDVTRRAHQYSQFNFGETIKTRAISGRQTSDKNVIGNKIRGLERNQLNTE